MARLPEKFSDLESKWGEWIIEEEADRVALRCRKTTEELTAFYDDVQVHIREYIDYIGGYDLNSLPDDVRNLWWLVASYLGVAAVLEMYGSMPKIPGVDLNTKFRSAGMNNEHVLLR